MKYGAGAGYAFCFKHNLKKKSGLEPPHYYLNTIVCKQVYLF